MKNKVNKGKMMPEQIFIWRILIRLD